MLALGFTGCRDQSPDVTPAAIAITPGGSATLVSGATLSLTASVATAGGNFLTGQNIAWISGDPSIAAVSPSGVVTGIHTGETQITAAVGMIHSVAVTVSVTPGAASQLSIRTQPAGAGSGMPFTTQPVVEICDAAGNVVTSSTATITATVATGGGTLTGSTTTAVAGVATFTTLAVSGQIGDRTLMFSVSGLTSTTSSGFPLGAGAPTKLVVRTDPTGATAGVPLAVQPVVEIRDDADNVVTASVAVVTAAVNVGAGTVTNASITAVNGIATFSGLTVAGLVGSRSLIFSSPGLTSIVSANFTLIAGKPAQLRIRQQPFGAVSGQALISQPVIEVTDVGGNLASSVLVVTAEIAGGAGTITGATVQTIDGVATFTALTLSGVVGTRNLLFSATGLTPVLSSQFTLGSGVASQLVIRTQPATAMSGAPLAVQPVVAVIDDGGNPAVNSGGWVVASIRSGTGSVVNPVAELIGGVATFHVLTVNGPSGQVGLSFSYANLPSVASVPVTVVPGQAAQLTFRVAPPAFVTNGVPMAPQPVIEVRDAGGNLVNSNVTVTMITDATSGTITNASAVAVNGVATFSGLTLAGPQGSRDYVFTAPGATPTYTVRLTINP